MATSKELAILLSARDSASKALSSVGHSVKSIGGEAQTAQPHVSRLHGLLEGLGKIGLASLAVEPLKRVGEALLSPIKLASDLNESMSKIDVVFADSAVSVKAFTESAAALGQSKTQAAEATGAFGNLLKTAGLTGGTLADMSVDVVKLGSDLASFHNIDVSAVLDKLRSGLVGESEPLRQLGVMLTEDGVKAKAMAMGLADASGNLSEAAKVQARYALILEQTKDAQGDFARTSTGMANATRIISATFDNLKISIGEQLLPVIAPMIAAFGQALPQAIEFIKPALAIAGGMFRDMASAVGSLLDILEPLWTAFTVDAGAVGISMERIRAVFGDTIANAIEPFINAFMRAIPSVKEFAGTVTLYLNNLVSVARRVFQGDLPGAFDLLTESVGEYLGKLVPLLASWGRAFVEWIAPMIPPLLAEVEKLASKLLHWLVVQVPKVASQLAAWSQEFIAWATEAVPPLMTELGILVSELLDWIIAEGPPLATTLITEWVPAFLGWVVQTAVDILPKLLELVLAIGNWIVTVGVPKLVEFAWKMGQAVLGGILDGLKDLGASLWSTIKAAFESIELDFGWVHISGRNGISFNIPTPVIPMPTLPNSPAFYLGNSIGGVTSIPEAPTYANWWNNPGLDTAAEREAAWIASGSPDYNNLPKFDAGGVVPGPLGARRLVVARGGEEFGGYPPRGGRSLTINVSGNTMLGDESRVARELARILKPELDRIVGGAW